MNRQDLKNYNLPVSPGVYFFYGSDKKPLYIGRATSLRDRVRSYFSKDLPAARGPLVIEMMNLANRVEWQETDSILEAILLEAALIKKHQPIYNTKEKSDKSFYVVVITRDEFPRVLVMRSRVAETLVPKPRYVFGPFPSASLLKEALRIIRKIFPFADEHSEKKGRDLFYRQIGLAPDTLSPDARALYEKTIHHIVLLFQGKKRTIIRELVHTMNSAAKRMAFEEANRIKKQIFALEHIRDVSLIKRDIIEIAGTNDMRIEAYDVSHTAGRDTVGVMTVVLGNAIDKTSYRTFSIRSEKIGSDVHALEEMLDRRLGHPEWPYPRLIVVDGGITQKRVAEKVLKKYGMEIPVVSVVKDEHHKPKGMLGDSGIIRDHAREILLANHEAHRFSLARHTSKARKKLLGK